MLISTAALFVALVLGVDLDIDSDNNDQTMPPGRSATEETLEMTAPGKIVLLNDDDDDRNGVID